MRYKHVIWDWNGTLINDRWLCVQGLNHSLEKRGLPKITEEVYREKFMFPVKDFYKKVGFDFSKEPFEFVGDEFVSFYKNFFNNTELHLMASHVVREIKNTGISQYILSAGRQDHLIEWVKSHNLFDYFEIIRGIDNHYAEGKIETGVQLKKNITSSNKEVIMIGDTIHDSEVADAMDIDCYLINHGHVNRHRLKKTGRKVFSNLSEILYYITN